MYYLCDFAEFNRKINVKAHTRILNGKVIPVRGARRTVLRLREALQDLQQQTKQTGLEQAYNANPKTGIVGNRMIGEKSSVNINQNYKNNPKKSYENLKRSNRHTLHSHTSNGGLSWQDFISTPKKEQTFAISTSGSMYRGYAKQSSYFVSDKQIKNHMDKIYNYFDSTIGKKLAKSKNPLANVNNLLDDKKYDETLDFLTAHTRNLFLKENSVVDYRFKLSEPDKALYELFKDEIKTIVKNKNPKTKFYFSKAYKDYKKVTGR